MSNAILNARYVLGPGKYRPSTVYVCSDVGVTMDLFLPAPGVGNSQITIADANVGTTLGGGSVLSPLTFPHDDPFSLSLVPGSQIWLEPLHPAAYLISPIPVGIWGPFIVAADGSTLAPSACWVKAGLAAGSVRGLIVYAQTADGPVPTEMYLPYNPADFILHTSPPSPNLTSPVVTADVAVTVATVTVSGVVDVQSPASVLPPGGATTAPVPTAVVLPRTPAI